jgi:TM2 domain-containing membrane protein YozV
MYRIIGQDGNQYGPVGADQLRRWIAENRATAQTLVQVEGAQEWKPLGSLSEFAADLAPPPVTPGVPPRVGALPASAAARAANKIPAGVCGILLGALGVHKFILGYTGAGLIMLLVTVLTCGLASFVTHIIGLIEGIIYLCKPDEEFVRTYVDGRKEWF